MKVVKNYTYQEQIEDLAKATGLAKHVVKRFLQYQRQFAQDKLRLGFGYNMKGVVKIEPKSRGNDIVLSSTVAQSVVRPITIKYLTDETTEDLVERNTIVDEDLM